MRDGDKLFLAAFIVAAVLMLAVLVGAILHDKWEHERPTASPATAAGVR